MKTIAAVFLLLCLIFVLPSCFAPASVDEQPSQTTQTTQPTKLGPDQGAVRDPLQYAYVDISSHNASETVKHLDWNAVLSAIPSDDYQLYPGYPTVPLKVTLYKNGEATELSVTDARLVRMMNFYYNAQHHNTCSITQGNFTMAKDVSTITASEECYLEIEYDPDSCYEKETVDFKTNFDKLIVLPNVFVAIDSDSPFGECPFTAFGRYPLFVNGEVDWLTVFGF